ncbi:MAG: AraC family transcriptional regulator [Kofleriaceae bacterium]
MIGVVRAGLVRGFGDFLAGYGVDPAPILAHANLAAAADPEAHVSLRLVVEMLALAARTTGDDAIGIAFAEQVPWSDVGVLAYVMLNSPTIGAAFANGCRYFSIASNLAGTALVVDGDTARLTHAIRDPAVAAYDHNSDLVLALHVRLCRDATHDPAWAPREVVLRRTPTARHMRFFRCPVTSDVDSAIVVAASELRRPLHAADPGLLPILLAHADACLQQVPAGGDFAASIRAIVIELLAAGDATIERSADRLGMAARSVQRRLADAGTSFSQVVEAVRRELAERYLADPAISVTEAAFLLGYSELSAFSRAFRRWNGQSAADFRRKSLAPT